MDIHALNAAARPVAMRPALSEGLGFETALQFLKIGYRAARHGWNGPGQFLHVVTFADTPEFLPYIQIVRAGTTFAPWAPSSTDLLAHDWLVIRDDGVEIAASAGPPQ